MIYSGVKKISYRLRNFVSLISIQIQNFFPDLPRFRIILQADIMTPSQQMFQELGWLPFPKRVKYHSCVMVFKALNGQAPEYLSDLLIKSEQIKNLRSNDKEILNVPLSKTAYYDRSFSVNGAKFGTRYHFICDNRQT